jgi:hypothetical protein
MEVQNVPNVQEAPKAVAIPLLEKMPEAEFPPLPPKAKWKSRMIKNDAYSEGFVDGIKSYHEIQKDAHVPMISFLLGGIFAALLMALLQRYVRDKLLQ